ncbi:hypothetical protein GUJ93_ZPchr0013g37937 [Zizania palustris]|uniref:Uncharacterized protein n=1 Tax=Zizania palustris TaxID=103762 RepID=A0A8J5WQM1_ZIZPA|nr:hypothetical protein GUJ93_ZPchr0013g37937 [Zizania palustris]
MVFPFSSSSPPPPPRDYSRRLHRLPGLRPPPRPPTASAASTRLPGLPDLPPPPPASHRLRRLHGLPSPPPVSSASCRLRPPPRPPAASAASARLPPPPPPPPASPASRRLRPPPRPPAASAASRRLCPPPTQNDTAPDIAIPVVMVSHFAGVKILSGMEGGAKVDILMYSLEKPTFDGAIPFLWLMAIGSVTCASVWTFVVVGDEDKNAPSLGGEEAPESKVVELKTKTALVFIVTASLVLLFLFFFKSAWSAWLLVVLYCIGGLQAMDKKL